MVALRSLDWEPDPRPSRRPAWIDDREVLLDEIERERDLRHAEYEAEDAHPNYALEGGIG